MGSFLYQRVFEIRLLHEYHLSGGQDQRYFELPENQREDLLRDQLSRQTYNIHQDLAIKPTPETEQLLSNYRLIMLRSPMGIVVAGEVTTRTSSGTQESVLKIPLDAQIRFEFKIETQTENYLNITNQVLNSSVPAQYYFTNHDTSSSKTYPSLSLPVSDYRGGNSYEMGELAVFSGILKQALEANTSSNNALWLEITQGFVVNENDRQLLPHRFVYSLPQLISGPLTAQLYRVSDGDLIKTLNFNSADLKRILLDFTHQTSFDPTPKGSYRLEVRAQGTLIEERLIYLDSTLYKSKGLAVVSIQVDPGNPQFDLLQANGALRRINNRHPIFEIRFKSRLTYWRYLSNRKLKLETTSTTNTYLTENAGVLSTLEPRPLIAASTEFSQPTSQRVYLPNPSGSQLHVESDGRIYSNIYTSGIKDLINEIE